MIFVRQIIVRAAALSPPPPLPVATALRSNKPKNHLPIYDLLNVIRYTWFRKSVYIDNTIL
jgi:hypothetical protein